MRAYCMSFIRMHERAALVHIASDGTSMGDGFPGSGMKAR